jgi:pyruvate/2-oxoglutarate dehydrogenase complex dihydrolipoamide dehydrogenase (E3) component
VSDLREEWDLVVVGGGAAGLAASRAGVARGARTLLVSEGPLGGECTFTGCVPSKTLIEAARRRDSFADAMTAVARTVDRIARAEADEVLEREGVRVVHARARLLGRGALDLEGARVRGRRLVLATGSAPLVPPVPGLDRLAHLTNEDVFGLGELPASLAVIGGGPVGCELAQAFARLGAGVTVIERLDRLLPLAEPEASRDVAEALAADGVGLRLGRRLQRAEQVGATGRARLHLDRGPPIEAERVLVAAGRRAVTDGLGLDAAGVALDERGFVRTDERLATSAPGVFAAGDVTGRLPFTHAADEMGRLAARNALARRSRRRFLTGAVPWVVFTDPEVAGVGLSERQAAAIRGARVAHLPMEEVDRAVVAGETRGFVKLVAGPRPLLRGLGGGRLLGATIVASRAGELIHEAALGIRTGMFAGRLAQTVHAYPTWSVAVRMAAAQLVGADAGRGARAAVGEHHRDTLAEADRPDGGV